MSEDALGSQLCCGQSHGERHIGAKELLAIRRLASLQKRVEGLHVDGEGGQLLETRLIDKLDVLFIAAVDIQGDAERGK